MAFHLKKPGSILNAGFDVMYYKGDNKWTNTYSERKIYENRSELESLIAPTTRRIGDKDISNANGAFKNSTIVSE